MPRSRIEMNRRRRLTSETIPPPPPRFVASSPIDEFEGMVRAAKAHPEECALFVRFLETQAVPEARAIIEALLCLPDVSLDEVENIVDKFLVAAESLAQVVNVKRDEEFGLALSGHAEGGGEVGPAKEGDPS